MHTRQKDRAQAHGDANDHFSCTHEVLMRQLKVPFFIFYQYRLLLLKIFDFISQRRSGEEDETLKKSVMELFFSRNVG